MRQNPEFIISPLADKHILVATGKRAADFNAVISLNGLGTEIWNFLKDEHSLNEIVSFVTEEYEVSAEQARKDIDSFLDILLKNGCILTSDTDGAC